jgi:hypothetical protein
VTAAGRHDVLLKVFSDNATFAVTLRGISPNSLFSQLLAGDIAAGYATHAPSGRCAE